MPRPWPPVLWRWSSTPTADRSGSVGINSGPAIAGGIGTKKFQYDMWGDTVNLASRMETQGEPGRIQITEATYRLIKGRFRCIPHGTLEVKGKGPTPTWYLEEALDQMVVGPGL